MSEPVIEVIRPCQHGYETGWCLGETGEIDNIDNCRGGSRVRYTRQEAIDRAVDASPIFRNNPEVARQLVDALLGETDV